MTPCIGDREFFQGIGPIPFEGPGSDNPLAFKWYDPDRLVAGKRMEEHLRPAVAYWHTFCGSGADPFGAATLVRPWNQGADALALGRAKMDAAFEFITKLGLPFYCFHDLDLVAEGDSLQESQRRMEAMVAYAKAKQEISGVRPLWGTANLTHHPRFMNGAATSPEFGILARAGAHVKMTLDATMTLGGDGFVFWGGREGYNSLLNTDMKRELEHLGRFLVMVRDYARSRGFLGTFFIEPKPMEPSKHQYDFDAATVIGFLRRFDLMDDFKLNIEVNHATLAQHSFQHELQVAADAGALGSIDANRGDVQNGWDTDQFPIDLYETVEAMLVLLEAGGLKGGGINFDAKVRRNSTDLEDLFIGHIAGLDTFARGLVVADRMLSESPYRAWRQQRYASFDTGEGAAFEAGGLKLEDLARIAEAQGEPKPGSGRQEAFESLINRYI